jgi:tripartite-type tricarboxylate transporter receptor subunit TctC
MRRFLRIAILFLASLAGGALWAQSYPARPIRFVVPFAPGGPTDILARAVGQKLTDAFGQAVVIENRGGAGGNIGAELVARSPADGYTMLMGATSTHAINPSLYRTLGFDPVKDFAPVSLVANTPSLLAVHPALPVRTIKDLIALAKARPGHLSYASAGNGSSNHLAGVLLSMMAGIDMVHVPYKGSGPALVDVISGQIPMMFNNTASVMPHVTAGKLRAVALASLERSALLPEIPTVAESGLPGFEVRSWHGVFVPTATPRDIVNRLSAEIVRAVRAADVRSRLNAQGVELVDSSPEEFAEFVRKELAKWAKVVRQSGARSD